MCSLNYADVKENRIKLNFVISFQGKVDGNKCALWLRWHLQTYMFKVGCFINEHCGKVLFVGLLLLSLCCVGLKTAKLETNIEELWVQGKLLRVHVVVSGLICM